MKIRYGRTRFGKVVEVDWTIEGHKRIAQSHTRFEDWPDRVDALSIFEALCIRGQRLMTQQDLVEEEGLKSIAAYEEGQMLAEVAKGLQTSKELHLSIERVNHGRTLLFSWYREGW